MTRRRVDEHQDEPEAVPAGAAAEADSAPVGTVTPPSLVLADLPVGALVPDVENPNEMTDADFNALVASIEEDGWTVPLSVVDQGDGLYKIVGGEHRWRAARVLAYDTVPCVLLDPNLFDADRRAWHMVRQNIVHGKLNPERFAQLYERMAKQYDSDVLQALMGFTSSDAFQKVYKEARDALPEALQKALDKQKDEIKTIDGLAAVLNGLFREFGETLPSDFMTFAWGSKDILWTMVRRRKTWDTITAAAREADQRGLSFAEVVATALTSQGHESDQRGSPPQEGTQDADDR